MGIPGLVQPGPKTVLKLGTGFISVCGGVVFLSRAQTQGSGGSCSRFQHFSSVCVLFFSLWSPGGAAEGQMLNVSTNASKRACSHNVEFPHRVFRAVLVCLRLVGASVCVCISVFCSMPCSSSQHWCVRACPAVLGRMWGCSTSEPANVL